MPSPNTFQERQRKLARVLNQAGLTALALNPGPTLTYLTGLKFHLMERPFILLLSPGQRPCLVLPELEVAKLEGLPFELDDFPYGENPLDWPRAFQAAAQKIGLPGGRVGVEANHLRFLELQLLEESAANCSFVAAEEIVAQLRMYKDEPEIQAMRQAADVAQKALQAALTGLRLGMSEQELANELVVQLLRNGSHPKMPFSPIVSFGPNTANPHASPTPRQLKQGDLLLVDWGASVDGYFSDITRTFAVGEVEAEFESIAASVRRANQAARAKAGPSISMAEVDRAARGVIEAAGYGEYFIHRTGHGLGMEGHEEPYIRGDNPQKLEPGMTFTIEPGIYLPGRGGVRIEDDVLITETGLESFTDLPRSLERVL